MKFFTKKLIVVAITTMVAFTANAQNVIIENFSAFSAGDSIEIAAPTDSDSEPADGWYRNRKSSLQSGASPVVEAGALSYTNYVASGQGNTVLVDTLPEGDRATTRHFIDSTTSVKVYDDKFYVSALVNVSAASSGFKEVFSLETNSGGGNFSRGRIFCRLAGDSLLFAPSLNGTPDEAATSSVVCALGETVLLVMEYDYDVNGTADPIDGKYYTDSIRLYVNPDLTKTAAENISVTNTDVKDGYHGTRAWLGMNIRQTNATVLKLSSIAWADQWDAIADIKVVDLSDPMIEDFSAYAAGDSIEVATPADSDSEPAAEWYRNRKSSLQSGASPVVEAGALSYTNYVASGQGNTVLLDSIPEGDRATTRHFIDSETGIKVDDNLFYVAALVNVSAASSGFKEIFSLETNSGGGNFSRGRIFCRLAGDSLLFAPSLNGTPDEAATSSVVCALNETVLLVMEYDYDVNASPDAVDGKYYTDSIRLYVNPDLTKTTAENIRVSNTDVKDGYHGSREWLGMNIRQTNSTVLKLSSIAWASEWVKLADGVGVAENNLVKVGNIYPNPSNGTFNVANSEGSDVVIYSITGQAVYQVSNISNNQAINANLTKGMYIVVVGDSTDKKVNKIIVE